MNGRFFISTNSRRRAAVWLRLFGTDLLPVLSPRPLQAMDADTLAPVAVYELVLTRLSQPQRDRLAAHVARETRRPYAAVRDEMALTGLFSIRGGPDIEVIEPEVETPPPAFVLPVRARTVRSLAFAGLF